MMERLTERTPKGAALKLNNPSNEHEAREQLATAYKVAVEKLADYEDMEEANAPKPDRKGRKAKYDS